MHDPTVILPYLELNNQGEVIRLPLTKQQHRLGRDGGKSDLVVPDSWRVVSGCHALLVKVGNDYHIYDGDGKKPSTNGLFVDQTRITPEQGHRLQQGSEVAIGVNARDRIQLKYIANLDLVVTKQPDRRSISLTHGALLGRGHNATLQLEAPTVSRQHAKIEPDGKGGYRLQDKNSSNGVFVNGQRVKGTVPLPDKATIQIGPFTLIRLGNSLEVIDQGNQIRLDAYDLVRVVKDKKGKPKTLLNEISVAIEPGQLVSLVGGSGAGKSTLMRTLLGIEPITKGKVLLNGDDLRRNFNIYRSQIGYVPQDDIIHPQLTVLEVLTYAAQLRLPPDIDVAGVVERTLNEIEMSGRKDVLVSKLSGGQRKRVSIGVELLSDPKLFFLDEPTSGLDPGLDRKMMNLLQKLASQGRTVILVTHATANITLCDRVAFLAWGGRLCYFGPPQQALEFFQDRDPSVKGFTDIYDMLEVGEDLKRGEQKVQHWADEFKNSDYYQKYVSSHLTQGPQQQQQSGRKASNPRGIPLLSQLMLLTKRYWQLTLRDLKSLGLSFLTAVICPVMLALVVFDKDPLTLGSEDDPSLAFLALRVLFVVACTAIWVGLSSSVQEIVREAKIYFRERLVNLKLLAYLGSKVAVLKAFVILQTLLMTGVILAGLSHPESDLLAWPLGLAITTFLTLMASTSLGLMVSAISENSSQANKFLPLLLVPQIIFSGVLFDLGDLLNKLSWLMLSRWSVGAYGSLVDVNSMIPEPTTLPDGSILPQMFESTPVYDPTWENLGRNWAMLILHAIVYLLVTLWLQKRKDIF